MFAMDDPTQPTMDGFKGNRHSLSHLQSQLEEECDVWNLYGRQRRRGLVLGHNGVVAYNQS
jgi:hypothetical protein